MLTCQSQIDSNEDKINNWAYQWNMIFTPNPSNKVQEVI